MPALKLQQNLRQNPAEQKTLDPQAFSGELDPQTEGHLGNAGYTADAPVTFFYAVAPADRSLSTQIAKAHPTALPTP